MKKTSFPRMLPLVVVAALSFPANAQQAFPTPDAAAEALVKAVEANPVDQPTMARLLGADWHQFIPTGSVDRADVDAFVARYREHHAIENAADGKAATLSVGKDAWTLPIPLAKGAKGWSFDAKAGAGEIRARRIGADELAAVQSVRAYHDAQMDYAEEDHDGDGVLEYAQKFISTDGLHDGLYWSDDDSGQISPLGPLFGDATPAGDWHGYHFRILDAQGASAPGGAYSYRLGDNMSRGFAVIAWPSKYDDTGVMSFMISHEGEVFQKDLGPNGAKAAQAMKQFDPDDSWTEVPDTSTAGP